MKKPHFDLPSYITQVYYNKVKNGKDALQVTRKASFFHWKGGVKVGIK
jgi:hypothetical protein